MIGYSDPVIELDGIYTAYLGAALPVIRDVSVTIDSGEYVIVGGPNGAGKTTLLESINGMLCITHGTARVCGLDVRDRGVDIRKKVGYVIQNFAFDPMAPFTVEHVILMGRYGLLGVRRRPGEEDFRAVEDAMRILEIDDLAEKSIGQLSGGQQQKVMIAQNIAKNPKILLLDEPFSNLDMCTREFVCDVLKDLSSKGMTILMVSHAFDALPEKEVRILVMDNGEIMVDDRCHAGEVEDRVRRVSGRR